MSCVRSLSTIVEGRSPSTTPAPRAGARRRLWYAGLTAAYLAAAIPLAYLSRDAICPDAVAYFQTARHWAAGRLDLAVNGWFSPLLSWLLVPAVWIGAEPLHVARALGVVWGLLFAAGTVRLARAMGGGRFAVWAYAAALVLSLRTVFAEVTPDFLMTAGLTWYFALAAEMIRGFSIRKAVAAGLLGGACYLAKSYALPVVIATLLFVAIFRWLAIRKEAKPASAALSQAAVPSAVALGLAVVVAVPWIVAISAKFGRFTTNTSASLSARSWPAGVPMVGSYPHMRLQEPPTGRMAAWENPAEAKGEWQG